MYCGASATVKAWRFRNALSDIVVVTLIAVDHTIGLEVKDVGKSGINHLETFGWCSGAMSFGLNDAVDDRRDECWASLK